MKNILATALCSLLIAAPFAQAGMFNRQSPAFEQHTEHAPQLLQAKFKFAGGEEATLSMFAEDPAIIQTSSEKLETACSFNGVFGAKNSLSSSSEKGRTIVILAYDISENGGKAWIGLETNSPTDVHFAPFYKKDGSTTCNLLEGGLQTQVIRKVIDFKWGQSQIIETDQGDVTIKIDQLRDAHSEAITERT